MGRSPCCAKEGLNRGAWTPMEDRILTDYIKSEGEGKWRSLPQRAGLRRCGKSCRLRWLNYLRPDIKRGNISSEEEDLIIRLHKLLGNRWSLIAGRLPGRTDNEVKNYWNTNLGKKILQGTQAAASTKCKPSSSTRSRSLAVKNLRIEEPICPAPNGSCVVRTKARRCTKVFTDADLQATAICSSSAKFRHGAMKAPPPSVADAKSDLINVALTDDDKSAELEPPSGVALLTVSPTFCGAGGEAQYSELLMDLEIDNKFLSDLLSTDFAGLEHDFDKGEAQGDIHTNEANDFIDPNSSHGAVLHDDHDSDLGSMAALLDYPAMDWLIVD